MPCSMAPPYLAIIFAIAVDQYLWGHVRQQARLLRDSGHMLGAHLVPCDASSHAAPMLMPVLQNGEHAPIPNHELDHKSAVHEALKNNPTVILAALESACAMYVADALHFLMRH